MTCRQGRERKKPARFSGPRALNMVLELTLLPTDYHEEACNYLNDWQLPAVRLCSCVSHADEIFSPHLSAYS